jgi:uncharacterized membrane protein YjjB (DUF3815 family)
MDFEWLEKGICLGFAAIGFAVLFNVPKRTLGVIYGIAALGGLLKFCLIAHGTGLVFAALCGSSSIGFLSVLAAHYRKAPPITFAIPALIPMIPGFFAYKAMVGVMQLTVEKDQNQYTKLFFETVNNGLTAWFVMVALAVGVAVPLLITRKKTVKSNPYRLRIEQQLEDLEGEN